MKFLVDEHLPRSLALTLRDMGFQADHVLDVGLGATADSLVARWAVSNEAVIVTRDRDFVGGPAASTGPAVVWIRVGNMPSQAIRARCKAVWTGVVGALEAGERLIEVR